MKKVRSILSACAFVCAIVAAVAGNKSNLFFTSGFGNDPGVGNCVTGTITETVACGLTDQSKGMCTVQFGVGGPTAVAHNDNLCLQILYRQQ